MQTREEELTGILLVHSENAPKLIKDLGITKDFFKSQELRLIIQEFAAGTKDIRDLIRNLDGKINQSYVSSLMQGIPKSDIDLLPRIINEIRLERLRNKVYQLINEGAKRGNFDHSEVRNLYEQISILEESERSTIRPILAPLSSTQPQPVEWLWFNRIPLGKPTLIVGDPGDGKSYLGLYLASRITTGRPWPDIGAPIIKGSVILLTAEDGIADTVRIRADAMDADVKKIFIFEGVKYPENDEAEFFNILKHVFFLEKAINDIEDVRLVLIDPITSYLGDIENNSTIAIRSALAPLAMLAEKKRVAIIAVSHLNKDVAKKAIYRAMGSLAYVAAARAVWAVSRDEDDDTRHRRFLIPLKTNLSADPSSLAFTIGNEGVVFEPDPIDITADEALSTKEDAEEPRLLRQAIEWLDQLFENENNIPATEVRTQAKEHGISERTLERAKKKLEIKSIKEGIAQERKWVWVK